MTSARWMDRVSAGTLGIRVKGDFPWLRPTEAVTILAEPDPPVRARRPGRR